jgi:hypothetical protein
MGNQISTADNYGDNSKREVPPIYKYEDPSSRGKQSIFGALNDRMTLADKPGYAFEPYYGGGDTEKAVSETYLPGKDNKITTTQGKKWAGDLSQGGYKISKLNKDY